MSKQDSGRITQYEMETWGRCADEYLDTFAGLTSKTIPLLLKSIGDCQGRKILDLGSGPGNVARVFAENGSDVVGVDFCSRMVEVAQEKFPNILFQEANGEDLPFESNSFDAVVCNYAVHHFAQPDIVFREISRILKPGGRFVFAVWGAPEEQSSIGAFFGAVAAHHNMEELPHGPLFGVTEQGVFEPLLSHAGLADCRLSMHDVTWEMDSLDPLLQGFWSWGDLSALPERTQEKISETTRVNSQPFVANGMYVFPHTVLLGVAVKE